MIETLFLILIIFFTFLYKFFNNNEIKFIKASNNEYFLVRNLSDSQQAAETLSTIKNNLINLINLILKENNINKHEYYNYILNIKEKLKYVTIKESSADSIYTSYSVNKGEELVFCIRCKITNNIHNINILMYVATHEIAHIGCPEIGHTELFRNINKYLLNKAIDYEIYKYINYFEQPTIYCGLDIKSTIITK